ncbi:Plasmodium vivax Vir protein, putative [Plasmodium vivax]|uniref:Vir protein, putative n=1 Tax=Plasmodium vivax TaxID=5855 RepID=A0A1G4ECI2_PLAVI|nr:Plasmodium vivax Vir protein, putative [Plasmodium vivax]
MSEINENEQISSKFYKRLDNPADISFLNNLRSNSVIFGLVELDEIKNILAKLARNIELIDSEYPENYDKRCRDINYWLNEKIATCKTNYKKDISSEATVVFNDIKWKKRNGGKVCLRNPYIYSSENAELMKELDDYCEIRDNNKCNILKDNNDCLKCNKYIEEKKQYFTRRMQGIKSQTNCKWDKYTIHCDCTLNNMDHTFPKISCKELSEKEESQEFEPVRKMYSPLEIGFFIIVFFILFYFFILFLEKFTPVGSIMSRFKRRKYDLKRNIEREADDRYSLYHSDTLPSDSENKSYYIEYARPYK